MPQTKPLFTRLMQDLLQGLRREVKEQLEGVPSEAILTRSIEDLTSELEERYRLDVPVLQEPDNLQHHEVDVNVSGDPRRLFVNRNQPIYEKGTRFSIDIPFEGDSSLFDFGFNIAMSMPPEAEVHDNLIRLHHEGINPDSKVVKTEFDSRISRIKNELNHTRGSAAGWNANELPKMVQSRLKQRKDKLLKDQEVAASIGYPLKRREGPTYSVPVKRKKIAVRRPAAKKTAGKPYKPEPELEMKHYEDILEVISNMALAIERTPSVFEGMEEETLRDFLLVMLNAIFEGRAAGEVFNRDGKTDILIRDLDRSIFIAECKIWDGPKALTDAIDQLLGYLCWRDTKAAVIIFSRRKGFSKVVEAIPEAITAHPNCKRQVSDYKAETSYRFILAQRDDPDRDITLTALAFDVPE